MKVGLARLRNQLEGFEPAAYSSARTWMLALVAASTLFWGYFGFDGTVEQLWSSNTYGTGVHWSTIQNFSLFFYVLLLNIQKNGIGRWSTTFIDAVKADAKINVLEVLLVLSLPFKKARKELFEIVRTTVEENEKHGEVGSLRGFAFAFLVTAGALTAFECIWVPLYDYFNFGNWAWPVYFANADPLGPLPFGSYGFVRNVGVTALGLGIAPLCLYALFKYVKKDGKVIEVKRALSVKWRIDAFWLSLVVIAAVLWAAWVSYPFSHEIVSASQLPLSSVISPVSVPSTLMSEALAFPKQVYFPQTDYTFYLASLAGKPYPLDSVYGFYVPNNLLHLLNVATKYATYSAICYPALVKVRRV